MLAHDQAALVGRGAHDVVGALRAVAALPLILDPRRVMADVNRGDELDVGGAGPIPHARLRDDTDAGHGPLSNGESGNEQQHHENPSRDGRSSTWPSRKLRLVAFRQGPAFNASIEDPTRAQPPEIKMMTAVSTPRLDCAFCRLGHK